MADSLQNYTLGASGVNVDKSEILMNDSELRSAQNATRDALGIDGGIRKRAGLKKFNASTMTSAVLGGIGLPLPLLVSSIGGVAVSANLTDPTADDGDGGTGVGSGSGIGGGTGDGGGAVGGAGTGGSALHGGVTVWGRMKSIATAAVGESRGWWIDSNNFDGSATAENFPAELGYGVAGSGNDFTYGRSVRAGEDMTTAHGFLVYTSTQLTGAPGSLVRGGFGKIYYPRNYSTAIGDTNPHPMQIWSLGIDPAPTTSGGVVTTGNFATAFVATIPNPALTAANIADGVTVINAAIASMISGPDGRLFVSVFQTPGGEHSASDSGRVYEITLDPTGVASTGVNLWPFTFNASNNTVTQADFGSLVKPYALCWHNGRLWCGTTTQANTPGGIYWFNEDPTVYQWVLDHTMGDTDGQGVTTLCSYNGVLYAGMVASARASGTSILIEARDALGNWTNSLTQAANNKAIQMEGAIVFNGKLYVCRSSAGTAPLTIIYQFDGTTWSVAYTGTTGDHSLCALSTSWVSFGELSFGGGGNSNAAGLVQTTDGVTWVDKSANLTNSTGDTICAINGAAVLSY